MYFYGSISVIYFNKVIMWCFFNFFKKTPLKDKIYIIIFLININC